jgi:glycosyltransferase involved in cell wall biosynthesis
MGQQPYKALPQFLAGWNVCLLPFAITESSHFINPTNTLEYMAAELPIVSTPVVDIVDLYGNVVSIAHSSRAFIKACETALLTTPEEHNQDIVKMREMVSETSWSATVEKMHELLQLTREQKEESSSVNRHSLNRAYPVGTQFSQRWQIKSA